jgi:hypothetical protein
VEDFSVVVSYEQIAAKNYSLSSGQYFDVKIEYSDLTPAQFAAKLQGFTDNLDKLFKESAGWSRRSRSSWRDCSMSRVTSKKQSFPCNSATLIDLCESITDCLHSTPKWTNEGKLVVRSFNIKSGKLDLSNRWYTDEKDFSRTRISRQA